MHGVNSMNKHTHSANPSLSNTNESADQHGQALSATVLSNSTSNRAFNVSSQVALEVASLNDVSVSNRLQSASLTVTKGQCVHILGPNGAGKSTLLLVLAGLLEADAGSVVLFNKSVSSWSLASLASMRTLLAQQTECSFHLTVHEYLQFYADIQASSGIPSLLEKALEVTDFLPKILTQLSGGERQRVEICRALLQLWPTIEQGEALVLLDEPLQGLDIRHQYAVAQLAKALSEKGNTVIMSSHDIALSANYATTLWLMQKGKIVAEGNPADVATQANLERVFECHFAISKHDNFLEIQVCAPITLE
ncbi:vitamin B12 import ATP-binding protein BtuD [Alteromonas sp. KC3]|nr:vitamin B12 import ATP-binding protein BtuD [Alteromonas sp. KC3]BCO22438.1 vitamin B12 import ATP-binding protein BtuD [Alteromonas sp. KC14]